MTLVKVEVLLEIKIDGLPEFVGKWRDFVVNFRWRSLPINEKGNAHDYNKRYCASG
ncbi:hypothetical protein LSA01_18600 [Latilactobacillus sakei]|nr:hypothetical protein LACBS_00427 [Latilactobacillus sakei subsp. sakei DSM 20017 = JCM 1157]GEA77781.1 hypothetical protein LSA01_18600 [Latilactobacillus sakei]GEL37086.1 hypothetical protein LSA02_18210 [Latilactobacillus sakei subsp. sakei]